MIPSLTVNDQQNLYNRNRGSDIFQRAMPFPILYSKGISFGTGSVTSPEAAVICGYILNYATVKLSNFDPWRKVCYNTPNAQEPSGVFLCLKMRAAERGRRRFPSGM